METHSPPLLFVNTIDVLQAIINVAWSRGELYLPVDNDFGQKYPIILYADDTLMIMPTKIKLSLYASKNYLPPSLHTLAFM
jgi:hypothetical protein